MLPDKNQNKSSSKQSVIGAASPVKSNRNKPTSPPRWPAVVALLTIGLLYSEVSESLTIGPSWLLLPVIAILLLALVTARWRGYHKLNRILALLATGLVTLALIASVMLLVFLLPAHKTSASALLRDAALIWITNVVIFGVWYWQIDGGGPAMRHTDYHETADFLFPQLLAGQPLSTNWTPGFIDYLFLAFNTSTAFSPTDTATLSRRAKVLMMLQSIISLVVVAILAGRAINIL